MGVIDAWESRKGVGPGRERINMNAFCVRVEIHWRAASGVGLGERKKDVKESGAC